MGWKPDGSPAPAANRQTLTVRHYNRLAMLPLDMVDSRHSGSDDVSARPFRRTSNGNETCRLCRRHRTLQESHLLPASLYGIIRKDSGPPVAIQNGIALQTSRQMSARLLCAECEQAFNRGGENWVLRNCYRGKGVFPLLELLTDEFSPGGPKLPDVHMLDQATAVEVEQLTYFGASVFWRAAARSWAFLRGKPVRLSLGPYEERFRQFLLGTEIFPAGVCLFVILVTDTTYDSTLYPPQELERRDTYRCYQFKIPGLFFQAVVGSRIPNGLRIISTHPGRCIHLTRGQRWYDAMRGVVRSSRNKGSLASGLSQS